MAKNISLFFNVRVQACHLSSGPGLSARRFQTVPLPNRRKALSIAFASAFRYAAREIGSVSASLRFDFFLIFLPQRVSASLQIVGRIPKRLGNLVYDDYTKHSSRSHDAVIRVYDEAGNVIETHEYGGEFKEQ